MEKFILEKRQLEILKILKKQRHASTDQLYGYFGFGNFTGLQIHLQDLERKELISKSDFSFPNHYCLTGTGKEYLVYLGKKSSDKKVKFFWSVMSHIFVAVAGSIATKLFF